LKPEAFYRRAGLEKYTVAFTPKGGCPLKPIVRGRIVVVEYQK